MNQYVITHLPFLLPRKVNNQAQCPKFCTLGGLLFTTVLHDVPEVVWQLPAFGWYLGVVQNHL